MTRYRDNLTSKDTDRQAGRQAGREGGREMDRLAADRKAGRLTDR